VEIQKRLWIGMVFLGACARLVPHPWNFTPIMAIGLFAGYQGRKASTGVLTTLLTLALSDAVMGLSACFLAAVPFYQNQILGDAFYTFAIFSGYAVLSRYCQPVRQAA
jgi:hypothetical protein